MTIEVPTEGRPTEATDSTSLLGVDGNVFSVIGTTRRILKSAGASREFYDDLAKRAMASSSYAEALAVCVAYLDANGGDSAIRSRSIDD